MPSPEEVASTEVRTELGQAPPTLPSRGAAVFRGLAGAATVTAAAAYASICFVALFVFSPGEWAGGSLVGSVARARDGGHFYAPLGSLLGPSWPYFPLCLFAARVAAALGVPLVVTPALLGGLSAFLLAGASGVFARCLGARWVPSLALSLVFYALVLPGYHTFGLITAGFFPDALVAVLLVLVVVALARLERSDAPAPKDEALFAAALVAAGLSKQVGVAGVVGSLLYLLAFSRLSRSRRRRLAAIVAAAGMATLLVVVATPGCLETTVVLMARHPKDWSRLHVVWDNLVTRQLPAFLVYLTSLPAALRARGDVRLRLLHHHCILLPVIAVQTLATVKEGGGGTWSSYNFELVVSLLLPVAAWAAAAPANHVREPYRTLLIIGLAGIVTTAAFDAHDKVWSDRVASWTRQLAAGSAAARLAPQGGGVCAQGEHFYTVDSAGLRTITNAATLWHYAQADPAISDPRWIEPIERALEEQRYALVLKDCFRGLPEKVARRLTQDLQESYVSAPGTPWMVPRKPKTESDAAPR